MAGLRVVGQSRVYRKEMEDMNPFIPRVLLQGKTPQTS